VAVSARRAQGRFEGAFSLTIRGGFESGKRVVLALFTPCVLSLSIIGWSLYPSRFAEKSACDDVLPGEGLMFTDAAVKEIAQIASERGTGARGLRSVVEETLEGVLFDAEAGVRYVVTEKTVRGGEAVKRSMTQTRAPLSKFLRTRITAGQDR